MFPLLPVLWWIAIAWADLPDRQQPSRNFLRDFSPPVLTAGQITGFYSPNEEYPQNLIPILQEAPGGAYMTVGTERGFIGASLYSGISHLVLMDIDPKAVLFNQMNIALLKMAKDRNHYLHLRLNATQNEWLEAAKKGNLDGETIELLRNVKNANFWFETVRNSRRFERFHRAPSGMDSAETPFHGVNYLFNDELFGRLQRLARAGKIDSVQINMSNDRNVKALLEHLRQHNISLGVLDVSNMWFYWKSGDAIDRFKRVSQPNSLLIMTAIEYTPNDWRFKYRGFRFDNLYPTQTSSVDFRRLESSMTDSAIRGPIVRFPVPFISRCKAIAQQFFDAVW